jgi:signal transduction histidine kinase
VKGLGGEEVGEEEIVMEERDSRQDDRMLLTQEEEASLTLLEPLFARHRDVIFEILPRYIRSEPNGASLLSDDLASARLPRVQQEHAPSFPNGEKEGSVGREGGEAADSHDPFGFGVGRQLQTIAHFLTSIHPLVFDAFGARPSLYHTVWNALLKVVFRDIDLAMRESLIQRDELVKVAVQDVNETRRALDLLLSKQALDEGQRQTEHRTVVNLLTTWLTRTSELAQEMGTPLNVILGRAESLLKRIEDDRAQVALESIVREVEQLILLRQQLCALNHGFNCKPPAPDRETMAERP